MFNRSRNNSRANLTDDSLEAGEAPPPLPPPPPPPAAIDIWTTQHAVTYFVRSPWEWVMQSIATPAMTRADTPLELPTEKLLVQQQQQLVLQQQQQLQSPATEMATPATRRRRMAAKKFKGPATLKIEIVRAVVTTTDVATETVSDAVRSSTNNDTIVMEVAVHGTSAALDGMEDKDELVRTLQRCRCDHLHLSPPAVLFSWDVTHDECVNVIGKNGIPTLTVSGSTGGIATNTEPAATTSDTQQQPPAAGDVEPSNADTKTYAVLKEPMGSQGRGIYFVASAEEIHKIIDEHHKRAKNEPDFLDNLIAVKGRIPSWVLQAEVIPSLLICGRRKFHIRTYVVILEKLAHPDLLDVYIFNRHEVRIAGKSVLENETERDPLAHITNGSLSPTTERVLLDEVEELTSRNLQNKTEIFVAEVFGKHLLPDIERRISLSDRQDPDQTGMIRKFAVAGLDIMVTEDNRLFLLEVNANPAAPQEASISDSFKEHLKGFFHNLVSLVVGNPAPDFLMAKEILVREGLSG